MQSDGTVFIVDDDDAVRDSLKLLLETHGFGVKEYASCEAFMHDYRPHSRQCLVLDQHLPGMTGLELIESLERGARPLPIILLTGQGDKAIRTRAKAAGLTAYLEKPIMEERLLPLLYAALSRA